MSTSAKGRVRTRLRAARAQLTETELSRRGGSMAASLARHVRPDAVVAGYMPMPGEPNVQQFLERHVERMGTVYLPVVPPSGRLLRWQLWNPYTQMRQHPTLPLSEPDTPTSETIDALMHHAAEVRPQEAPGDGSVPAARPAELVVLVPTLALDRAGARLGQGGGYYDTTMAHLTSELRRYPGLTCELIAVVHADEFLDSGSFPVEDHDLRVARAVTEYRVFDL